MACCSILFTNSEYVTLFETPLILSELQPLKVWLKYIVPKTVHQESWIFLCHIVALFTNSEYATLFLMPSILSELQSIKVWLKYIGPNGLSGKLDFSMPCCSILFTNSEYATLFETPSILSELQPLKVWLKYMGPKTVHQESWIFLCHVVAFCSQTQNMQFLLKCHQY